MSKIDKVAAALGKLLGEVLSGFLFAAGAVAFIAMLRWIGGA
jgi:hypothetical protein